MPTKGPSKLIGTMNGFWSPGDHVLVRDVEFGLVHSASPCTVVYDGDERTVLYLAAGTPSRLPDGWRYDLPPSQPVSTREVIWRDHNDLGLFVPEALHSLILRWDLEGSFLHWYVNLTAPARRTSLGFDYWDKALDIIIPPDLNNWRWKDEDHFEEAQRSGQISLDEAESLRREGERVLQLAQDRKSPFDEGWEHWRPNSMWPIPILPDDWDRIE
jgi:hypothetical protein